MANLVVLLRAVNLGGVTQVSMAAFREILEEAGLREVRTILQSGNAVASSIGPSPERLEAQIGAALERRFHRPADAFVRTAAEWRGILEANPFPREAAEDPGHLVVTVLRDAPPAKAWEELRAAVVGRESVGGRGREAYIVYRDGIGSSKLTAQRIERALGTRGTSRNWNTVGRLADALTGSSGGTRSTPRAAAGKKRASGA